MSATIPAPHAERLRLPRPAASAPPRWRSQGAHAPANADAGRFRNALTVLQAIGGSTNGLIHLTAIAGRAGHRIDLEEFDRLGREVPVLVDLKPSGAHYMEHFHHAGGIPRLMRELADLLDLDRRPWPAGRCATRWRRPKRCRART